MKMTEKQYFKREYDEEYYIFDSEIISEDKVDAKIEYVGYKAFEDSMGGDDVVNRLNEQNETITILQNRNKFIERKIDRERASRMKQHEQWSKEAEEKIKQLEKKLSQQEMEYATDLHRLADDFNQSRLYNCSENVISDLKEENNELFKENEKIKSIIKDSYKTERTHIGKNVLKQLMGNIGMEIE